MTKSRTVVFLDFDGVCHPRTGSTPFNDRCMQAIKLAFSTISDLQIVVSSSWREEMNLEELAEKLAFLETPVIDITPVIDEPFLKHVREHECRAWVEQNPTELYFALDDDEGFFSKEFPVFIVDTRSGFQKEYLPDFQRFIEALNKGQTGAFRMSERRIKEVFYESKTRNK
jgi:hypothetical protein